MAQELASVNLAARAGALGKVERYRKVGDFEWPGAVVGQRESPVQDFAVELERLIHLQIGGRHRHLRGSDAPLRDAGGLVLRQRNFDSHRRRSDRLKLYDREGIRHRRIRSTAAHCLPLPAVAIEQTPRLRQSDVRLGNPEHLGPGDLLVRGERVLHPLGLAARAVPGERRDLSCAARCPGTAGSASRPSAAATGRGNLAVVQCPQASCAHRRARGALGCQRRQQRADLVRNGLRTLLRFRSDQFAQFAPEAVGRRPVADHHVAERAVGADVFGVVDVVRALQTPDAGAVILDLECPVGKLGRRGVQRRQHESQNGKKIANASKLNHRCSPSRKPASSEARS